MSRIENVQAVRGTAILLVLSYHLFGVELKYFSGWRVLPDYLYGGVAGVDLFFVVSGFIMATVTRGCFRRPEGIASFVYSRFTRIYPLYWLYSLPLLGLFFVRPDLVNPSQGSQVDIVASFLLVPQQRLPLLIVGWTLIHEVYFYAVVTVLLFAPERYFAGLLLVWAALVVGGHQLAVNPSAFVAYVTNPMTLEFIAGCLVAIVIGNGLGLSGRAVLASGAVLLFGGWAAYHYGSHQIFPWGWRRIALFGVPGVLIVSGAVAMEQSAAQLLPRALRSLGDASYSLYLSHVLVTSALGLAWSRSGVQGRLYNSLALLVICCAGIAAGVVSHRFLEGPVNEFFRAHRAWVVNRIVRFAFAGNDPSAGSRSS